jgi:hypothetical protein
MSADDADGLDAIEAAARTVKFGGKSVRIRSLTVGQLPPFARAIKPMLGPVVNSFNLGAMSAEQVVGLIADHGEQVVEAASIATGIPVAEINAAGPDELMLLVAEVLTANRDFLNRLLNQALQAAAKATPGTGPTPSSL